MAGLSLKNIYKVYPGRNTQKKGFVKTVKGWFKKTEQKPDAVEKRSGNFVAVKDFNMEIEDGEFIVFVGPSGCGKSTTLRMIAGLEDITSGEMYIGDTLVNDVSAKDRDIAMVFQSYALYPHMTSYQNIAFGLKMRKIPVENKDENGNPVLAIDQRKIRELRGKIKNAEADLRYAEEGEYRLLFRERLEALDAELTELKGTQTPDAALIEKVKGEIKNVKLAEKAVLSAYRRKKAAEKKAAEPATENADEAVTAQNADIEILISEAAAKAQEAGVNVSNVKTSEIKTGILQRKAKFEEDLKYYQETPVQTYTYKHMPKEEIDEKVKWAAGILGITELLDIKPSEMSGGQRQRIALGRAMVRGPKVFLLDEPLSNLDAKLRTTMRSEIVKLHNQLKTTFIYVTHDQIEAMTMGTRIDVMKLGVVQQIDTPTNLFDYPQNKFVAGFIGTPQMNFFDVTVKRAGESLEVSFANGQKLKLSLAKLRTIDKRYLDGGEHALTLGVRGENLHIAKTGLETTLSIKEVLGNTTQLFVRLAGCEADYIVCVPERNDLRPEDKVIISFDEKHVHLFDKENEKSVMQRTIGNE